MQPKDLLPVIGVLVGAVLGWLLSQLGQWFVVRREEKKAIARVLSDLLEIRLRLLAIPRITELLSQHFPIPPEGQTAIKIAFERLFPADVDMGKRYGEAVSLVAACSPILGFRLRSQDLASPLLNTLRQLALADSPAAAASLTTLEAELMGHLRPRLERLVREVAWMHSWTTWWGVGRILQRPMELPEGFLEAMKSQFPQVNQGVQERDTPPAPVPDLIMPNGFPEAIVEGIINRVVPMLKNPSPEPDSFLGARNGIRFRLRACADYSEAFTQSLQNFGDAPPVIERFRQEAFLFGFFVSGLAALDSFSFLMYLAAAQIQPSNFPTQKPGQIKRINCKTTSGDFATAFPNDAITIALRTLVTDPHFSEWDNYRNILAHRSAPGRKFFVSVGQSSPDRRRTGNLTRLAASKSTSTRQPHHSPSLVACQQSQRPDCGRRRIHQETL